MVSAAARTEVTSTIMLNTAVHSTDGAYFPPKPRPRQQRDRRCLHGPAAAEQCRDVDRNAVFDVMNTGGERAHIVARTQRK
jgi:hypothetical protein